MSQQDFRELFLQEFTKKLIKSISVEQFENIKKESLLKKDESLKRKNFQKIIGEKINRNKKKESLKLNMDKGGKSLKLNIENVSTVSPSPGKKFTPISATKLTINPLKPAIPKEEIQEIPQTPIIPPVKGYPNVGKLNLLISDVGVESIECLGANKNVIVKKGGKVQQTRIILTRNEIKQILEDFSQKTKIPLQAGTFKAILNNLILTAIISEFSGTRFIIQKKTPSSFKMPL
tara:strand:- start:457 stop:1155 length:699 start_codon:yes stop_codon:yes gene_type:complete